jgi:drug/metabolite transporter (DMT)-like permease
VLIRIWLAFAVAAVVAGLLFAFLAPNNLLRSDDSYVVGFLFGLLAAAMASVYSAVEKLMRTPVQARVCYFLIVTLWSALLLIASLRPGDEGRQAYAFCAWTSPLVAILILPVLLGSPSRRLVWAASAAVAVGFLFYINWVIGHWQ